MAKKAAKKTKKTGPKFSRVNPGAVCPKKKERDKKDKKR